MNEKEVEKYIDKIYKLENYDVVKKDLFIQALSKTRDADNWKDGIYCMVGDIVLTVQLKLEENERRSIKRRLRKYNEDALCHSDRFR